MADNKCRISYSSRSAYRVYKRPGQYQPAARSSCCRYPYSQTQEGISNGYSHTRQANHRADGRRRRNEVIGLSPEEIPVLTRKAKGKKLISLPSGTNIINVFESPKKK